MYSLVLKMDDSEKLLFLKNCHDSVKKLDAESEKLLFKIAKHESNTFIKNEAYKVIMEKYEPLFIKKALNYCEAIESNVMVELCINACKRAMFLCMKNYMPETSRIGTFLQTAMHREMFIEVCEYYNIKPAYLKQVKRVDKFKRDFKEKNKRMPTDEEIMKGCDIKKRAYAILLDETERLNTLSLDWIYKNIESADYEGSAKLLDLISYEYEDNPETLYLHEQETALFWDIINSYDNKRKDIALSVLRIGKYEGIKQSNTEIAQRNSMSVRKMKSELKFIYNDLKNFGLENLVI